MTFCNTSAAGTEVMNLVDLLTRSENEGGCWFEELDLEVPEEPIVSIDSREELR
jgi:hypothetical protein